MKLARSQRCFPCYVRRGMTLLEIVLAMGILVVVSSMTYWFYSSTLRTGERSTDAAFRLRLARVVLDRITTEIRQASAITADGWVGIKGEPESIRLSTYRVPSRKQSEERRTREEPRPAEYDLTKVEYKIARHPEILDDEGYEFALGLARVEIPIPRPLPVKTPEQLEDEAAGDKAEGSKEEAKPVEDDLFFDNEEGALGT